jgi:predicted DNA-binding transcriptional regulator YafY
MDRTERFYKIEHLLTERRIVPVKVFLEELEISLATFKRDIEYLRSRLHAPIVWDREQGGYRFEAPAPGAAKHELPGLWFNASEIHALLTMQHLLAGLEPGLLTPHVQPLLGRLRTLLSGEDHSPDEIERRIRVLRIAARPVKLQYFELAATATLKRKRLKVTYWARSSNETTERELSPQRLVFYRGNWYLDAWCHMREGLRSFSIDGIRSAALLDTRAKNVPETELDETLAAGYGIFSGKRTQWAKLKFSPAAARWVAAEEWHPQQKSHTEPDGAYVLEIPYSDDQELLMDILRHGAEVEVLASEKLRQRVADTLLGALKSYSPLITFKDFRNLVRKTD